MIMVLLLVGLFAEPAGTVDGEEEGGLGAVMVVVGVPSEAVVAPPVPRTVSGMILLLQPVRL